MCDKDYFMDYLLWDFPEVIGLAKKNENNEWKLKDFLVGYVEDCIDWRTEVVSAWIAEELGLIEDVVESSHQTIDSYSPSKRSFFIHGSDKYYGLALHFKEDLLDEAANSSNAEILGWKLPRAWYNLSFSSVPG